MDLLKWYLSRCFGDVEQIRSSVFGFRSSVFGLRAASRAFTGSLAGEALDICQHPLGDVEQMFWE